MPVPFTFGKREVNPAEPAQQPPVNAGQPSIEAARLERLRAHTRAAIEDLGRLRLEVETKTLGRFSAVLGCLHGVAPVDLVLGDSVFRVDAAGWEPLAESAPGGWHSVAPETVDSVGAAMGDDQAGAWLFTLLERVDELQGVVESLVDRIEPVLERAERAIARHATTEQPVDHQVLDAQDRATLTRLMVLGTALDVVLGVRLLQDDGALMPGHEAFLEQVRRAVQ